MRVGPKGVGRFLASPWSLLVLVLIASASAMMYEGREADTAWPCELIATGQAPGPDSCFRVRLLGLNRVLLEWRVSSEVDFVYLFDVTAPDYSDPGFQPPRCEGGSGDACALQLEVEQGGHYQWVLRAGSHAGDQVHMAAALVVPPLPPPTVQGGGFVDRFQAVGRDVSWQVPEAGDPLIAAGDRWVELQRPGEMFWSATRYPARGPGASLRVEPAAFAGAPPIVYRLRSCLQPSDSAGKFCSPAASIGFNVGHDRFLTAGNLPVEAGRDLEVAFTAASGTHRLLSSDSLLAGEDTRGGLARVAGDSYLIPGASLTAGVHRLRLDSCEFPDARCTNRVELEPAAASGTLWQARQDYYREGDLVAAILPQGGQALHRVVAPVAGRAVFERSDSFYRIARGEPIGAMITGSSDQIELIVDGPVDWQLQRPYTLDFAPGRAWSVAGFGQALDVAFDDIGGIWQLNEFSNNLEHLTAAGEVETLALPLARWQRLQPTAGSGQGAWSAARPFGFWFRGAQGSTSISNLAERVHAAPPGIWLTQGGGLQTSGGDPRHNHSRVVSLDLAAADSPDTEYDDRFCVYNLPADDPAGMGNNQAIGLTLAGGRVWVAESRGLLQDGPSLISSFVPNPAQCENLLNFHDPRRLAAQALQYCLPGRTPEQDGCVERITLGGLARTLKVAHLERDPDDDSIWFSDASGQCLGNLSLARPDRVRIHRLADPHAGESRVVPGLGGFPWNLEVDHDAVYLGEYATRHILRLDKRSGRWHEIAIPYQGREMRLHSLARDPLRQRLWFTLANEFEVPEGEASSTIGYIDLESWRQHLESPDRFRVDAVIYAGLDQIPASEFHPGTPQGFRGIAFDPDSGRLALATMWREQITVLQPQPGFWP